MVTLDNRGGLPQVCEICGVKERDQLQIHLYYGDSGMMESGRFDNSPLVNRSTMRVKILRRDREQFMIRNPVKLDIDWR